MLKTYFLVAILVLTESTLLGTRRKRGLIMYIEGLDEIDNKILNVIQNDARLSYSEIGEKVGVSRVTVRDRMANLENKGIILGYQTKIVPTNLPDGILFFMDIETDPYHFEGMLETLCEDPIIRQVYSVSGNCSVHAVGFASSTKNLQVYVNRLHRTLKGMRRFSSYVAMSTIKDLDGGVEYESRRDEGSNINQHEFSPEGNNSSGTVSQEKGNA